MNDRTSTEAAEAIKDLREKEKPQQPPGIDISKEPLRVICHLKSTVPNYGRIIYYSVTLNAAKISPSRKYIRLGDTHGDEITGWVPIDDIFIDEVLHKFTKAPPEIPRQEVVYE